VWTSRITTPPLDVARYNGRDLAWIPDQYEPLSHSSNLVETVVWKLKCFVDYLAVEVTGIRPRPFSCIRNHYARATRKVGTATRNI